MTNVDPNPYYLWAGSTSSPVYNMEKNIKQNRMMRLVGNAFVRITPFKDFRVELSASANYYDLDGNKYSFQVQAKVGQRVKANLLRVATLQVVFGILYYKL